MADATARDDVLTQVVVARQPIFDRDTNVVAYELRHRTAGGSTSAEETSSRTVALLVDGWLAMGAERLTNGLPAYIRAEAHLLRSGHLASLDGTDLVVVLARSVEDTPATRAAIDELRAKGFGLCLGDVRPDDGRTGLLDAVDRASVDIHAVGRGALTAHIAELKASGREVLAVGVESPEDLDAAMASDADLVEGFFYARPEPVEGKRSRGFEATRLQLLEAVSGDDVDVDHVEDLIRRDLALADRFLRFINSAAFSWRREIVSLKHAVVLLGDAALRSWVSLLVMDSMTSHKPPELLVTASVRARFCENLGRLARLGDRGFDLFAAGMFSVLDAAFDLPMAEAIEGIPLPEGARKALLGEPHPVGYVLTAVVACEQADWLALEAALAELGVPETAISGPYLDAIAWSGDVFGGR